MFSEHVCEQFTNTSKSNSMLIIECGPHKSNFSNVGDGILEQVV